MAVYGLACIFLYALPAVVFLLPTSLVAAELASGWDGGVYNWVSQGISPQAGFLAIWTQFAMTLTYYPSLLAYVAIIGGGLVVIGLAVPFLFLRLRKPSWKNAVPAPDAEQG